MSRVDLQNWDIYYSVYNKLFAHLDEDWTDPKRFPRGVYILIRISKGFDVLF